MHYRWSGVCAMPPCIEIFVQSKDFETAKAANLSVNGPCENDGRGCIPQTLDALQGAYTDDEPR